MSESERQSDPAGPGTPEPQTPVRRTPLQERSRDTVQRILEAASLLLATMPLAKITTNLIARQAQLSIGALYRFFPDKQAIIDALAARHLDDLEVVLTQRLTGTNAEDGPALLSRVIDDYLLFMDARPDFRAIARNWQESGAAGCNETPPDRGGTAVLKRFLTERMHMEDTPNLELRLRIANQVGELLIFYAYEQSSADRPKVIGELKRLLSGYLFGV